MDILVHCSLREGLARALPQALLAGKPAVSFDIDGAREVVRPGETGFLLPPRDVPALVDALSQLTINPALRAEQGRAGQSRCREVFRHEYMTERIREVYARVLGENTGGTTEPQRHGEDRGIMSVLSIFAFLLRASVTPW
jgi:glycosyltransferase involved in cell wall biosynthesis